MKLRHIYVIVFAMMFLMGCGQPGELGLEPGSVGLLSVGDENPNEVVIQEQIKICRQLAGTDQMKTHNQTSRFEDTKTETGRSKVCEFAEKNNEVGGNLSMNDSLLRARYTQNKSINLPSNAVICDIEIESQEQDFIYDDVFFLNLNQGILASNHKSKLTQVLAPENFVHSETGRQISIYNYDWLKLRNTKFENEANDFCIGQDEGLSTCKWPITEQNGKIQLKFDSEILIRLSQNKIASNQQISFVITGDDNPESDCYHQRMDLSLKVQYYLK